jgi:membrane protein implicated in regulation of membrane protease activity
VPVPLKYGLLQLPGLAVVACCLWLLCDWGTLSRVAAWIILALWVAKDAALYPFLRHAYDSLPSRLVGPERLIGQWGIAQEALAPTGYVRVSGELWRAECTTPGARVGAQDRVRVCAVQNLTLLVSTDEETPAGGGC